jgi:DNA-binding transcriptional LysR family regulator
MDTRFLQTLVVVGQTSSFAETARRLHLTPSAVVQRIRALEDELGSPLVARSGHSVQLTGAGNSIIAQAQQILTVWNDIRASVRNETGEVRIGAIGTTLCGIVPALLTSLKQHRSQITVQLLAATSIELFELLEKQEIDVALMVKPQFKRPKTYDWLPIRYEPFIVIASMDLEPQDGRTMLTSYPFIRYDRIRSGGVIVDAYLKRNRIITHDHYELQDLGAISAMVNRNLGISLVPDWAPPWPEGLSLQKIAIENTPVREIGLLWSRTSPRIPLVRALIEQAERLFVPRPSPAC